MSTGVERDDPVSLLDEDPRSPGDSAEVVTVSPVVRRSLLGALYVVGAILLITLVWSIVQSFGDDPEPVIKMPNRLRSIFIAYI